MARGERLERLCQVFTDMGWVTTRLLADTPFSASIFMEAVSQIRLPTLVSGQGASSAMGGAYLLARALHETGDYREAF